MKKPAHSNIAYEYIRKAILSGEYSGGRPLLESVFAEKIGVSRTPVREALRQLEAEGLVTIRSRMGAVVKSMSLKDYREMCEVRQSLESSAAGLAALNRDDNDLETIGKAFEAMARHVEAIAKQDREPAGLLNEVTREDIRFHMAILTAARNDLMKKEILRLHLIKRVVTGVLPEMARIQPAPHEKARRDVRRAESLASHKAIYEAICKGDAATAKAAMEEHIQEVIDLSLLAMARTQKSPAGKGVDEQDLSYMS